MYWLIEDLDQLTQFYNSGYNEAFIEVIPTDHAEHPTWDRDWETMELT